MQLSWKPEGSISQAMHAYKIAVKLTVLGGFQVDEEARMAWTVGGLSEDPSPFDPQARSASQEAVVTFGLYERSARLGE